MNYSVNSNIIKGVYLLILMIVGGQAQATFSKQTISVLSNSYMAKHIIVICLIYFTVDFSSDKSDHPLQTLYISFIIWVLYIVISKQHLYSVAIIFVLITILYILYEAFHEA